MIGWVLVASYVLAVVPVDQAHVAVWWEQVWCRADSATGETVCVYAIGLTMVDTTQRRMHGVRVPRR